MGAPRSNPPPLAGGPLSLARWSAGRWRPSTPPSPTHRRPAGGPGGGGDASLPERRPREPCWTAPSGGGALNSARGGVGAGSGGRAAGAVPSGRWGAGWGGAGSLKPLSRKGPGKWHWESGARSVGERLLLWLCNREVLRRDDVFQGGCIRKDYSQNFLTSGSCPGRL